MPMRLDTPFAQELCDMLHAELGLVCSFMDLDGCIVASSERERLGGIHPIALRIMRGEMDEYRFSAEEAQHSATEREGINMGIDLAGRRLACFAIAGPLDVVQPLARIVRFCVTSLLQIRREETPAIAPDGPDAHAPAAPANLTDLLSHASQTVESSLTRLHEAVNHIDQGITLFDRHLRLVVWNQRFLELIG